MIQPFANFLDTQSTLQRARELALDEATLAPLLATLAEQHERLRLLTIEKQLCAKAFGPAKRQGDDLRDLKARMQEIGMALTQADSAHGDAMRALTALFDTKTQAVHDLSQNAGSGRARDAAPAVATPITITALHDADCGAWQTYVQNHPQATLYHDVRWRGTISRVFGHQTNYLVARDHEQRICGVLPLVRQRSRLFGDFLTSLPFLNYAGALADSITMEDELMRAAGRLGERLGVQHVEFRDMAPRSGWPCRDDKVSMKLALPDDPAVLLTALGSKLRAQIRRPERESATVELCSGAAGASRLIDDFYAVFAHNMRDVGTPVYTKRWFAAICADFADQVTISVARIRGRPVGAAFLMRHRQTMEVPWASTRRAANPSGINMLLYWRHLVYAMNEGCRVFDFGRSTRDAGTYRFKQQWGAQPTPLYWHYWLREGAQLPQLNPDNPRFRRAITAWQQLPVWVTRIVGPPIVRAIP